MYRTHPATARTAAMPPMLYGPFDVHAVHLRGNLRNSKAYPWGTFCRKTKFEGGSPNLTTDPGQVTCLACLKRLREKADAPQATIYIVLSGYSTDGIRREVRTLLDQSELMLDRLAETDAWLRSGKARRMRRNTPALSARQAYLAGLTLCICGCPRSDHENGFGSCDNEGCGCPEYFDKADLCE